MPMCLNTGEDNEGETWEWWNNVRTLTEHFPRIFLGMFFINDSIHFEL